MVSAPQARATVPVRLDPCTPAAAVPAPDRIEIFGLAAEDRVPKTQWLGCIPVPAAYALNDVALAPDGTVYGSHQFDRPASSAEDAATRQKWLDRQPTGYAMQWRRNAGWTRVPGTAVSFANGISVSGDGHWLAVAGTYSHALILVNRQLGTPRLIPLPHTPGNLTALPDGSFLSVGHTGCLSPALTPAVQPKPCPAAFRFRSYGSYSGALARPLESASFLNTTAQASRALR